MQCGYLKIEFTVKYRLLCSDIDFRRFYVFHFMLYVARPRRRLTIAHTLTYLAIYNVTGTVLYSDINTTEKHLSNILLTQYMINAYI